MLWRTSTHFSSMHLRLQVCSISSTPQSQKYVNTLTHSCVIVDEYIHSSLTFLCSGFYSCNTEIMPGICNWTSGVQVRFVGNCHVLHRITFTLSKLRRNIFALLSFLSLLLIFFSKQNTGVVKVGKHPIKCNPILVFVLAVSTHFQMFTSVRVVRLSNVNLTNQGLNKIFTDLCENLLKVRTKYLWVVYVTCSCTFRFWIKSFKLQSFYFKLRSMIPCCLCHLNFTVAVPEEELIQVKTGLDLQNKRIKLKS